MAKGVTSDKVQRKVKVTLYLPPWVARKLKYVGNQSVFTEKTLIEHHGWKRPGPNNGNDEE